jgi:outer membrane protein assembly factor BamE (lipoprotein component of BamABCDE complex)
MPRRWWFVSAVVLFLAAVLGWNLYLAATRPRWHINRERFEQIKEGMTRDEVLAVIGLPPGDYSVVKWPGEDFYWIDRVSGPAGMLERENWASDDGWIAVTFDKGKALDRSFNEVRGWPARPYAEVLRRLFVPGW